jgi:hypothetical protein
MSVQGRDASMHDSRAYHDSFIPAQLGVRLESYGPKSPSLGFDATRPWILA